MKQHLFRIYSTHSKWYRRDYFSHRMWSQNLIISHKTERPFTCNIYWDSHFSMKPWASALSITLCHHSYNCTTVYISDLTVSSECTLANEIRLRITWFILFRQCYLPYPSHVWCLSRFGLTSNRKLRKLLEGVAVIGHKLIPILHDKYMCKYVSFVQTVSLCYFFELDILFP